MFSGKNVVQISIYSAARVIQSKLRLKSDIYLVFDHAKVALEVVLQSAKIQRWWKRKKNLREGLNNDSFIYKYSFLYKFYDLFQWSIKLSSSNYAKRKLKIINWEKGDLENANLRRPSQFMYLDKSNFQSPCLCLNHTVYQVVKVGTVNSLTLWRDAQHFTKYAKFLVTISDKIES